MKILSFLILLFCVFSSSFSQSINGRFVELLNNGSNYEIKVQINSGSSGTKLGTSTLVFTYNSSALLFPQSPQYGTDYQFHGFSSPLDILYDSASVTLVGNDRIYINVTLLEADNGSSIAFSPAWTDLVTIKFTTVDPSKESNINWVDPNDLPYSMEIFTDSEITLFARGNFSGINSPLPVELTLFRGESRGDKVFLYWETATESNNYGFEIERENDLTSGEWLSVGFVQGAGNSNSARHYSFTDPRVSGGEIVRYRLKQIDTDGGFEYSDIIEVALQPDRFELYQNYPNPFNPTTKIRFSLTGAENVRLTVYDQLGRNIKTLINEKVDSGLHEIEFDASELASGVYFYRIITESFTDTKKMIFLR